MEVSTSEIKCKCQTDISVWLIYTWTLYLSRVLLYIQVTFEEISTSRQALAEEFTPIKYDSETGQALFIDIVDKATKVSVS